MRLVLITVALADLALGGLLVAVSGFILQGVNNTGPMMPEAVFFVAVTVWCFAAPLAVWMTGKKLPETARLAIAVSPLAIAAGLLLVSP